MKFHKLAGLLLVAALWSQCWCRAQSNGPVAKLLTLYPACPCYHLLGVGNGETRIDAAVNLAAAQRAGTDVTIQLVGADGDILQTESVSAASGGIVGVDLHVPVQAVATFRVQARLVDGAGRTIARAATDVRICPRAQAMVGLGPDGFLRVEGRPDFPLGLYSAAQYKEIAKAGFTVTHHYEITTGEAGEAINHNDGRLKELLDQSWANGMRMMVELPRQAVEQAQWTQVARRIRTFQHHPGLLCWDSEERVARGKAPLKNVAELYRLVRTLDHDHPFVLGDSRDLSGKLLKDRRDFFPEADMDVGIWWWYPIPLKDTEPILEPPSWLTTTICKKPLWIAIQAYTQPWQHSRYPTPAEYRAMAYLSIINGVKGLFFYTGSGEHDFHHKPAGLLNQPENSHWDYVQTLLAELHEATPIILAPPAAAQLKLSPTNAPVESVVRELDGTLYLLAANKSVQPQTVRFSGPSLPGRRPQVLFETHTATIEGDTLKDRFEPLGVHVYKLECK